MTSSVPLDDLDASLRDFEHPDSPPLSHHSVLALSEAATDDPAEDSLPETDLEEEEEEGEPHDHHDLDSDSASAGGYSPPAWRRLDNGDRSSGFWRGGHDVLGAVPLRFDDPSRDGALARYRSESDDEDDEGSIDDVVLKKAIRTKLPRGSVSPEKGRSVSPERHDGDTTLRVGAVTPAADDLIASTPAPPDNYIRFAVRAEVQHRTEPIEAAVNFIRRHYTAMTATRTSKLYSICIALFSFLSLKLLFQVPESLPAGDLVKVAGIARSFEPLIYYSEHAVAQVHDLQATSVAVWDLGESVRTSDMKDVASIVSDLDALSETMKMLAIEMTRFFARVDGDIDGVLNVMDWAKMHLNRLHNSPAPSPFSSAYDNLHNMLSNALILQDETGAPTALGTRASHIFGLSNPQRHQRNVQLVFNEFLAVLESSIASELQHSVTLFALFEAVDAHFLNLARTVVREYSLQEELRADQLSGLWVRILGPKAAELRKFEENRMLLNNVREKTVRNKGTLVEHNGKLLSLKTSLEGLRARLVSPLLRGRNSTTLTLEDQIQGISDVSEHLGAVRRAQRSKVMESLFASVPGERYMHEQLGGNGATSDSK